MTAEALSGAEADVSPRSAAADGSPRPVPDGDAAPALAETRQSVVDVVAARLVQVAEPDDADPPGADPHPGGALADRARPGDAHPAGDRPEVDAGIEPAPEPTGDAGRFAATAVLDVLRASGWADADEAQQLRAEADRLRELLDLVVRDHRAREASAAGLESQQHHWLIPLLRAAHGVAFGSLGAKVALRTAVQEVPEQILASAGLRIDYGVENTGEADEER